jgi:hypothetical protein
MTTSAVGLVRRVVCVDDPWGFADTSAVTELPPAPHQLTDLLARLHAGEQLSSDEADDVYGIGPEDFVEIAALLDDGWDLVDDAPLYVLVPAAWSAQHRIWVRDRLPHVGLTTGRQGEVTGVSTMDVRAELRRDLVAAARNAGLPDPPEDRIWLVRSPWPGRTVEEILDTAWEVANAQSTGSTFDEITAVYLALTTIMREGLTPRT